MWLLQLPPKLSNPFIHGTPFTPLSKPATALTHHTHSPPSFLPSIKAMKSIQGKVVCSASDKTVAVEVVRLAPHPKYKRRVRKKKKYQAHDPENQFKVGDIVQLTKTRPISKTKAFLALPVPSRGAKNKPSGDLPIPLESEQEPQQQQEEEGQA
ncbi:30S ribosomal protein S17, chloroplastic [Lotus japonicus]|uniref:30S ribosomal protein S17, chloroplastic n=1 Tax=Lotus japonicus TaxID=34305 RepID=UPI00258E7EC5|nr:30S ribosomal protein S17, chloroplastic [Lotus japonicus]